MKKPAILTFLYSCLVLVGGIIGYKVANSTASLIASTSVFFILSICSYFMWKGQQMASYLSKGTIFCLILFFGYRYFLTQQFMPAGMMILVSSGILVYLMTCQKACLSSMSSQDKH